MSIRVVQLGSRRLPDEGIRIGTVRRPPRGVPKSEYAARNWYDVWLPSLSPSPETMKLGQAAGNAAAWARFARRYQAEMTAPDRRQAIALLAALSYHANFSIGCYCEDASRCHRSLLRSLLVDSGALVEP